MSQRTETGLQGGKHTAKRGPFEGRLVCPTESELRSISFNRETAARVKAWGESSDGAVDRVIDAIRSHFQGTYVDFEGKERRACEANVTYQFGEDPGRWMAEYFKRADGPYTRRLNKGLVRRVMFIWIALEVADRRLGSAGI
ncbi:MAG: hypothetical protein AAGK02_00815 [Pseudomonadota bacterium]